MRRRPVIIAGALLAMTFAVGGLAGMAFEEAFGIDWFEFLDVDPEPGRAILADLRLNDAQKATIEDIFERQEDELEAYWEGRLPELRTIVYKTDAEIRAVLNDNQRVLFDQRIKAREGKAGSNN
jgi:Spy/CpxP family protein refolding chaperone